MANRGFIPGHKAEHEANQLPSSGQEAKNAENSTSISYPFIDTLTVLSYFYCGRFSFNVQHQEY
jgi:hypothetical protein